MVEDIYLMVNGIGSKGKLSLIKKLCCLTKNKTSGITVSSEAFELIKDQNEFKTSL